MGILRVTVYVSRFELDSRKLHDREIFNSVEVYCKKGIDLHCFFPIREKYMLAKNLVGILRKNTVTRKILNVMFGLLEPEPEPEPESEPEPLFVAGAGAGAGAGKFLLRLLTPAG